MNRIQYKESSILIYQEGNLWGNALLALIVLGMGIALIPSRHIPSFDSDEFVPTITSGLMILAGISTLFATGKRKVTFNKNQNSCTIETTTLFGYSKKNYQLIDIKEIQFEKDFLFSYAGRGAFVNYGAFRPRIRILMQDGAIVPLNRGRRLIGTMGVMQVRAERDTAKEIAEFLTVPLKDIYTQSESNIKK